jgi:hypothetical protein
VSWVFSIASAGCSWWVCEAMEEERKSVGSMEAAGFGAGLGSLGGWSWISGGGERKSWKREEENEMNFFYYFVFYLFLKIK